MHMLGEWTNVVYGAIMNLTVTTPFPHEFEHRRAFEIRWHASPFVKRTYATPVKRRIAAVARWAKAKNESIVSLKTSEGECLLFGRLD